MPTLALTDLRRCSHLSGPAQTCAACGNPIPYAQAHAIATLRVVETGQNIYLRACWICRERPQEALLRAIVSGMKDTEIACPEE